MQRFKRILLYADPGAKLEPGLRYAAHLAKQNQGVVTVVDCLEAIHHAAPPYQECNPNCPECMRRERELQSIVEREQSVVENEMRSRLDGIAETLREKGVPTTTRILNGHPADAITSEVSRTGQDLVIKTARGVGERKERAFFGTTAIRLMRICPCAVCVVDPAEDDRFDRIVAAVDPSSEDPEHRELNEKILDLAVSLAKREGGTLDVIHAWSAYGEEMLSSRMPQTVSLYVDGSLLEAESRLDGLVTRFGSRIAADRVRLYHGDPETIIASFVTQSNSDLVVMGTVGRSGLQGIVMGNTAEQVIRKIRCSVLAVKPDTFISPIKQGDETDNCDAARRILSGIG